MKNGDLPHKNDDFMGFPENSSGFMVDIPKLCVFFFRWYVDVCCLFIKTMKTLDKNLP